MHRAVRAVLWSVVVAALGYVALSLWAGWREVVDAIVRIGPWVLLGVFGLSLLNYLLRFFRWGRYLALLGTPVPWRINLDVYFAGFALTTTPGKVGETLRSVLLKPHGVPAPESLAAFFAERTSDLLAILVLTAFGLWTYAPARPVVGAALLVVLVVLLLVQWTAFIAAVDRWALAREARWAALLSKLCEIVLHFRRCFSLPALAMGLMLGVVSWFAEGLGLWWLLYALGYSVDLQTAVFVYAFAMLVGSLSFLPGGLGTNEAAMITLLVMNGVPDAGAVTATLICRLATLWFAVVLGAGFMVRVRRWA
jgi:uncharacterized protein (TIRG00374 family)